MSVAVPERPLPTPEQDERYLPLLPELQEELAAGYSGPERMPYHGWPHHPFSVRDANLAIRKAQLKAGVSGVPSEFVTIFGSLAHDYLLDEYIRMCRDGKPPAPSAELYAAQKSGKLLLVRQVDPLTVAESGQNILGTAAGVRCTTLGMLNLCFADLNGTAEDFETVMKPDTAALRREKEIIEEKEVDELKFGVGSVYHLLRYRYENLLVPRFLIQNPDLLKRFVAMGFNLQQMTQGLALQTGEKSVRIFARGLGSIVERLFSRSAEDEIEEELAKDQAAS